MVILNAPALKKDADYGIFDNQLPINLRPNIMFFDKIFSEHLRKEDQEKDFRITN